MTDDIVWKETLILTSSCLRNLYASGHIESLLASLPSIAVCDGSISVDEKYYIYAELDGDILQKKEAINIQPLIDKKLLRIVSTDYPVMQMAAYIASLGVIDDGETIPCAIALRYDWMLVTDDSYTIDLLTQYMPQITYLTTIDIFKYWADICCHTTEVIEHAIRIMHKRALYTPSVKHRWYS